MASKININTDTHEQVNIGKYFYQICYLQKDRSKPEKAFEQYILNHQDHIEYWCKNGDSGTENFSIEYEFQNEKAGFFPDYIIKLSNGKTGLFESKDKNDNTGMTLAKAERLQQYIQDQNSKGKNLFGGIVANFGDENSIYIKINRKAIYSTNISDWEDLDAVL
jgi:type III restriction enzyme